MKIWKDITKFKARNPVATIGIFDGVHRGHVYLINALKEQAKALKGESVIVTLWPHPRIVLNKDPDNLRYLTSIEEKTSLIERNGIDHMVIIPFTIEFSRLSSCQFVEDFLVKGLGIKKLIVGFNHKFGRNREGDYINLRSCAEKFGFELERLLPVEVDGERISSSLIRELLIDGDLERANIYLDYDFFIKGKVVEGKRIGRQIDFPTANIEPDDKHKLIPKSGVYAVQVLKDNVLYDGMLNIGYRPTVNRGLQQMSVETHLFDFQEEIYGSEVLLFFRRYMREEKKFTSLEQLRQQLVLDKEKAIEILKDLR